VIHVDAGPTQIEVATLSDIGRQRSSNQDSCGDFTGRQGWRLLVVADGMGGHQGGATASGLAVETIRDVLKRSQSPPMAMLREAFEAANRRIYEKASQNLALQGMGTTAVVLLLDGTEAAWVAHVGDSRAYRLRANLLEPLTRDHSVVVQLMETKGVTREEAEKSPNSHVILRAIGVEPEVEADVKPVSLGPGDRFLLCSDGLWGEVPDGEIAEVLQRHSPADAVRLLVAEANHRGGPDNITVQVAVIPQVAAGTEPPSTEKTAPRLPTPAPRQNRWALRASVAAAILALLLIAYILWLIIDRRIVQLGTTPASAVGEPRSDSESPPESD
jgi:protein phosphatase